MGLRSEESRDRRALPAYRNVKSSRNWHVDEWLPAKEWTTEQVWQWCAGAPVPTHWVYDSVPGALDRRGNTRCSCSLCVFANRRDLLLAVGRRPRLAALYAEVEEARRDSFKSDITMRQLIGPAAAPGAPDPGIRVDDDTEEFTALRDQVRAALHLPARKAPDLALLPGSTQLPCQGCPACPAEGTDQEGDR